MPKIPQPGKLIAPSEQELFEGSKGLLDIPEPPDDAHIRAILALRSPHIVVACGKQAEAALGALWDGALIAVPHPAHRLLTDQLYREARDLLADDFHDRIALRQLKGSICRVDLGKELRHEN